VRQGLGVESTLSGYYYKNENMRVCIKKNSDNKKVKSSAGKNIEGD